MSVNCSHPEHRNMYECPNNISRIAKTETQIRLEMLKDEVNKAYEEFLKLPGHGRRSLSDMQHHFCWFLKEEWCLKGDTNEPR